MSYVHVMSGGDGAAAAECHVRGRLPCNPPVASTKATSASPRCIYRLNQQH